MKPQFNTLNEFFVMGGYGNYVWAAWGLSLAVIAFLAHSAFRAESKARARLEELEKSSQNGEK